LEAYKFISLNLLNDERTGKFWTKVSEAVKECAMSHSEELGWDEDLKSFDLPLVQNFIKRHFDGEE